MVYLNTPLLGSDKGSQRLLSAVEGYLFLNLPQEALMELGPRIGHDSPDAHILRAHIRILLHLQDWEQATELASKGIDLYPDENEFLVQRVFALQRLCKPREAVRALSEAPEWLRRTGILHYNLGCYEALLGDVAAARQCITAACELNASFKKNARQDPDLERIWN